MEVALSRIINLDSVGKERTRLTRAIVLTIRELAQQSKPGPESLDMAAFISFALQHISETIDISVAAWEKRGYWVKADRFRMVWIWAGELAEKMRTAVMGEDWISIAETAAQIGQKLGKINLPKNHRLGRPWLGAWIELMKNKD